MIENTELKQVGLKQDLGKLQMILGSRLYSDPYVFMIETAQNATDAHRKIGKENIPFSVSMFMENSKYWFSIRDFGCSFDSKEDFVRLICTMLESDKTQKKSGEEIQQMGKYGIGSISFAAYQKQCEYIVYKNKRAFSSVIQEIEGKGIFHKESDYSVTEEEDGVYFKLEIKSMDLANFYNKMQDKLSYFQNINFYFDENVVRWLNIRNWATFNDEFIIYKGKHFQFSTLYKSSQLHICLDQYSYPINWEELGVGIIFLPIGLRFNLNEFEVSPTRESIIIDDRYKQKILDKFKEAANELIDLYNIEHPVIQHEDYKEFVSAYTSYENQILTIKGKEFKIKDFISEYGSVRLQYPTFKSIPRDEWTFFKKHIAGNWRHIYLAKSRILYGRLKRDKWIDGLKDVNYIVTTTIPGTTLNYIKSISSTANFVTYVPPSETSNIGTKSVLNFDLDKYSSDEEYRIQMDLRMRNFNILMEAFHNAYFIKIEDVIIPEEWYIKNKVSKKSESVKKLEGEIGLKFARTPAIYRSNCVCVFEEKILQLSDLYKTPYFTVYGTEKNKGKLENIWEKYKNLKIAMVGTSAEKRLNEMKLHNYCNVEDMAKLIPQISKYVTAGIIKKKLGDYKSDILDNSHIIKKYLCKSFAEDIEKLEEYYSSVEDESSDFTDELEKMVEALNCYDRTQMAIFNNVMKDIDKFDFVCLFDLYIDGEETMHKKAVKAMLDIAKQRKIKMDWQHYKILTEDEIRIEEAN